MAIQIGIGFAIRDRRGESPPVYITGTAPVLAALTDGDTLSDAVTWGSYTSAAGEIVDPTTKLMREGAGAWIAYDGDTVVAEGEVWTLREVVADMPANTATFDSEPQTVAFAGGLPEVLEYHGGAITFTVIGDHGQFVDGSYWTTGEVIDDFPAYDAAATRVFHDFTEDTAAAHGRMFRPGNAAARSISGPLGDLQAANYGHSSGASPQGFDGLIRAGGINLGQGINFDADWVAPLPHSTPGVILKARSQMTDILRSTTSRPNQEYIAAITVVAEAPPAGSLRPPISGDGATIRLNTSTLDMTRLRDLPVADVPSHETALGGLDGGVAQAGEPDHAGAGREVERHRLLRRDLAHLAVKEYRARAQAARAQVVGEAAQARERLDDPLGHEGARALALAEQALGDQARERFAHGDPRHPQQGGQITFGRQRLARRQAAVFDLPTQHMAQALIGRIARCGLGPIVLEQSRMHTYKLPIRYQCRQGWA